MKNRIQLTDTTMSAVIKMADGNPGASVAMVDLLKLTDPLPGLHYILLLDTFEIYGTDIYVLWSDICEKQTEKMASVLLAAQHGKLDVNILKDASHRQDRSGKNIIPVDELHQAMSEV